MFTGFDKDDYAEFETKVNFMDGTNYSYIFNSRNTNPFKRVKDELSVFKKIPVGRLHLFKTGKEDELHLDKYENLPDELFCLISIENTEWTIGNSYMFGFIRGSTPKYFFNKYTIKKITEWYIMFDVTLYDYTTTISGESKLRKRFHNRRIRKRNTESENRYDMFKSIHLPEDMHGRCSTFNVVSPRLMKPMDDEDDIKFINDFNPPPLH
jgi:hypothetical protein